MMPFVTGSLKSFFNLSLKRKRKKKFKHTFFFFNSELSLKVYLIVRWGGKGKIIFFPNDIGFSLKSSFQTSHISIKESISRFRKAQIGNIKISQFSVSELIKLYKIPKVFKYFN